IAHGPAVRLEEFEIGLHRVGYREWPVLAGGMMGAGGRALARQGLCLPVGKDAHAGGVGEVVGGADHLELIALVADIMPRNPFPRAAERPAVAEVYSWLQGAVIRLAAPPPPAPAPTAFPR